MFRVHGLGFSSRVLKGGGFEGGRYLGSLREAWGVSGSTGKF